MMSMIASHIQARQEAEVTAFPLTAHHAEATHFPLAGTSKPHKFPKNSNFSAGKIVAIIAGSIGALAIFLACLWVAVNYTQRVRKRQFDAEEGKRRHSETLEYVEKAVGENSKRFRGSKPIA
jgi:hypothetical protein